MNEEKKSFALVADIAQCTDFGEKDDNDKVIAFAVVRFRRSSGNVSRFAVALLNDSVSYVATYDLSVLYTEKEYLNAKGEFLANEAFKSFCEELPKGSKEEINLFDIDVSEISTFEKVWNVETSNEISQLHIATYGTRENAKSIAKRGLNRALKDKIYTTTEPKDDENED